MIRKSLKFYKPSEKLPKRLKTKKATLKAYSTPVLVYGRYSYEDDTRGLHYTIRPYNFKDKDWGSPTLKVLRWAYLKPL